MATASGVLLNAEQTARLSVLTGNDRQTMIEGIASFLREPRTGKRTKRSTMRMLYARPMR